MKKRASGAKLKLHTDLSNEFIFIQTSTKSS